MIDADRLNSAVQALAQAAPLEAQIVLFGSHARGDATEGSDLDFLVIEDVVENRAREMVRMRHKFSGEKPRRPSLNRSRSTSSAIPQMKETILLWVA